MLLRQVLQTKASADINGNKNMECYSKGAFIFNVIEKEKKAKDKGRCQNILCRFSHNDSTVQPQK